MREELLLYINGKERRVRGEKAFLPLSEYLRYELHQCGTKIVCAEGDCGACSVLLGRESNGSLAYEAVNSCILYMYQLDCTHVITIEGLKQDGKLNPIQEAMVACHGAQCGYCTPGIVVTMCGALMGRASDAPVQPQEIRDVLTGNLCRCTGYEPIIKAGCAVKLDETSSLSKLYPSEAMLAAFQQHQLESLQVTSEEGRCFFKPVSVAEAVKLKADHPDATLISGGTDIGMFCNKRNFEPPMLISTTHLPGLNTIELDGETLVVGAAATLSQLERAAETHLPELARLLEIFGSPQIKNSGTLAGNIANGSPIGDTLPALFVLNAEVELTGLQGSRRMNMNALYTGYKQLAKTSDELITRIFIPLPKQEQVFKLYKVSRRRNLDISTFTAAFLMEVSGGEISDIRIAYGGVGPTVLRLPKTEAFLSGQLLSEATFRQAGELALSEITPLSDVRGSQDFRNQLAENILLKFYYETGLTPVEALA